LIRYRGIVVLLQELSEAFGVSGAEEEVRQRIIAALQGQVDELHTDALGNLFALKRGDGASPLKVMVAAHMDEVGLMITHIGKEGLLSFRAVGGVDTRLLLARTMIIGEKRVPGVIGLRPIHLLSKKEREIIPEIDKLAIDIGASSKEEAESLVQLGDYAVFSTSFGHMDRQAGVAGAGLVKGKAFDDRAGCAVLVELLRERYPFDLNGVFTTQEEVGLRGAQVAAYALEPDLAFVLEGTVCDDLPRKKDTSPTTRLGHGPALTIMDRSLIVDQHLLQHLMATAQAEKIPFQLKQPGVGSTDGGAIQRAREGVPTAVVAVPCRYIHAPAAVLSLADYDNTVKLMKAALRRLPEARDWRLKAGG
jgi:putative aminopeptidase FrvX